MAKNWIGNVAASPASGKVNSGLKKVAKPKTKRFEIKNRVVKAVNHTGNCVLLFIRDSLNCA